jgi:hypothetical protein
MESVTSSIKSASGVCVIRWNRERLALFEQCLSQVFQSARDQQPSVRQVEALRNRARKVERLRNDHFAQSVREIKGNMVTEHTFITALGSSVAAHALAASRRRRVGDHDEAGSAAAESLLPKDPLKA